jgi:hypothetical protein
MAGDGLVHSVGPVSFGAVIVAPDKSSCENEQGKFCRRVRYRPHLRGPNSPFSASSLCQGCGLVLSITSFSRLITIKTPPSDQSPPKIRQSTKQHACQKYGRPDYHRPDTPRPRGRSDNVSGLRWRDVLQFTCTTRRKPIKLGDYVLDAPEQRLMMLEAHTISR